jgi:hypothetical protein
MEGSMRWTKILPAILAMVPAIVFLTAQVSLSEPAAEACKTKAGSSTPPGGHWYYRINRADKRHCWFLSAVESHVRRGDQAQTPIPAADATSVAVGPPVLSASPARTMSEIDFSARWPEDLPRIEDANFVEPPSISRSYADPQPATDTAAHLSLRWPVVETTGVRTSSIGETALDYISFAGLLATASLLLAGWAAKFAQHPMQPHHSDWRPYSRTGAERYARSLSPRSDRLPGRGRQGPALGGGIKNIATTPKRRPNLG